MIGYHAYVLMLVDIRFVPNLAWIGFRQVYPVQYYKIRKLAVKTAVGISCISKLAIKTAVN